MHNWYYFYNKSDISDKDLRNLSSELEGLGYRFYQPQGLGAGPSPEQVILWLSNNQFISSVSIGLLSNYLYDMLKKVCSWYKQDKLKNNKIPVIEIFILFKDRNKDISDIRLKFRIDKKMSKKEIQNKIKIQTKYKN